MPCILSTIICLYWKKMALIKSRKYVTLSTSVNNTTKISGKSIRQYVPLRNILNRDKNVQVKSTIGNRTTKNTTGFIFPSAKLCRAKQLEYEILQLIFNLKLKKNNNSLIYTLSVVVK